MSWNFGVASGESFTHEIAELLRAFGWSSSKVEAVDLPGYMLADHSEVRNQRQRRYSCITTRGNGAKRVPRP